MPLPVATLLRTPIREDPQEGNVVFLEEGEHAVVEEIGRNKGVLSVVELCRDRFGIGVDEGLLVDPADAFQVADVESILGAR